MLILSVRASVSLSVLQCVSLMGLLPCTGFYTEPATKGNKMQMSPSAPLLPLPAPPPQVRPGAITKKEKGGGEGAHTTFATPHTPPPIFLSKGQAKWLVSC